MFGKGSRRIILSIMWAAVFGMTVMTSAQNAAAQGGGGIQAAVSLINGEPVEGMVDGVVDVPYEPVGPDDVA